jgi:hypothetical protein
MRTFLKVAIGVAAVAVLAIGASAALDRPARASSTTTIVDAPREQVWRVVADFDAYPDWNPYLRRVEGRPEEGGTLQVRLEPPGGEAQDVSASVSIFRPPRKIRWQSHLLVPGLRDLEYEVIIEPLGADRSQVFQQARHEGLLSVFVDEEATRAGLLAMSRALETRVESGT